MMPPVGPTLRRRLQALGLVTCLAGLAACSTPGEHQDSLRESARYAAQAQRHYTPPGPPSDPWGPYIREASTRFDVPETWVRALMRVESGGSQYNASGQLITSNVGAMGLMQVMPETYDDLRSRYNLGSDPFEPHNNILAGVAYMRAMYDQYGSPAFLAAYNAGPTRLDDYLANRHPLPAETRHYVAMIGPSVVGISPNSRSLAENVAYNTIPIYIPAGRRYGNPVMVAKNGRNHHRGTTSHAVEIAQMPQPPRFVAPHGREYALLEPPAPPPAPAPARRAGFHLINTANAADAAPAMRGPAARGQWAIQVGAYANQTQARVAIASAQNRAHVELSVAHPTVIGVSQGRARLWRARMTGISRETAVDACRKISHAHTSCIVLSPDVQS
jgi:hypothetical protein